MVPVGPGRCQCPERGCWLPGNAAVSQSSGHPSARSSGPTATRAGPARAAAGSGGACAQVQLITRHCNKW